MLNGLHLKVPLNLTKASHSPLHSKKCVTAAMQDTASLNGCNPRFVVLPYGTAADWDGARFEPPTILSRDNLLCSLSYKHKRR